MVQKLNKKFAGGSFNATAFIVDRFLFTGTMLAYHNIKLSAYWHTYRNLHDIYSLLHASDGDDESPLGSLEVCHPQRISLHAKPIQFKYAFTDRSFSIYKDTGRAGHKTNNE